MLELAILGLLGEQELHGYEIRKRLREELGFFSPVSFGSLYPALSRLERSGAVVSDAEPNPGGLSVPMTGSLSGERAALRTRRGTGGRGRRGRKVYRITDEGRRTFAELLAGGGPPDDARTFDLRLSFARHLAPSARLSLLERRRAVLVERLAEAAPVTAEPGIDSYTRSVMEHTAEGVARDIRWLDHLIEAERREIAQSPEELAPSPTATTATTTTAATTATAKETTP